MCVRGLVQRGVCVMNRCSRCNIRYAEWGGELCYPCRRQRNGAELMRKKMYFNRKTGGGENGAQSKRWSSDYLR